MKKKEILSVFLLFMFLSLFSQENEIVVKQDSVSLEKSKINYKQFIIPSALVIYGVVGLESHQLLDLNTEVREEIREHIDKKLTIDDFSQYAPLVSIYALDGLGIKSKHSFKDKAIITATSYLIMGAVVNTLKSTTVSERPDRTSNNSFPSGHTATAFMGAELLHQEYKDKSLWYSLSGYAVASATGFFRMYNNRHWFSDVAAGAGIGMLSTKIAYFLYPYINKLFFKENLTKTKISLLPYYGNKEVGFGLVSKF
ncbi:MULTISPECIES: phosphatase PAP2 family protein [Flavobacterium]|uniref:Phosphatidic acid phosphatase type 2/haloperoxidase domain-containing protein n=1 Tax=Flavobacterium hankyongi TaxID=1176532 RepID=A0ABP8ZYL0_9FLAO|nr:phosphatase PAP2 family protein [Flavobacterium sp. N1846]